jgi:hypothetical protein
MPGVYQVLWNDDNEPVLSAGKFAGRSEIEIHHRRPRERTSYRKLL